MEARAGTATSAREMLAGVTGLGIQVGVLDTGVDSRHEALRGCISSSQDVLVHEGDVVVWKRPRGIDFGDHGTACAGLIHQVAPGAELHSVCVLDLNPERLRDRLVAALEWACRANWDVVNVSLGCRESDPQLEDVVARMLDQGQILVAAKDNRPSGMGYPAALDGVLCVDLEHFEDVWSWRVNEDGRGEIVEASGVYLQAPRAWGGWSLYTGSSFACPIVSGIAARYRERYPRANAQEFRAFLIEHSRSESGGWPGPPPGRMGRPASRNRSGG